ncbi:MAG: DUF3857 domain-containing protein [Pseudomonas sp.]
MRYLFIITALVINTVVYAQTPSEKRDQRLADEAAKKSAQAANILSEKFDKHSASIKDVPEQFKDESVVILFNSANYFIERGDVIYFVERVKTRVYLKDKAAVEKYSTYYTSGYGPTNSSEVTIIKANGTSRTLQLKDGIEETNYSSIPLYYKSSVMLNQTYYKFALADLEPGDIIDFTQISKNPMGIVTGNIPFSRIYLASDFPVVKTFITIDVPTKDSYLYLKSLNGAPEMTQKNGENGLVTFTLEDSLREKVINDRHLAREKFLPHVKFILTRYIGDDNNQVIPVRTPDKRIRTGLSNEDLTKTVNLLKGIRRYSASAAKIVMAAVIEKNPAAKTDVNKLMELCWYYVRKKTINQEYISYYEYYLGPDRYDMYIAGIFMEILLTKKQTFDLILCTSNKSAGIKNVISPLEISWGIRWNGKYIMCPSYYMQFGQLPNYFNGVDALIVNNYNFKLKTFTFTDFVLPTLPYTENTIKEQFKISLDEDFEKINCTRIMSSTNGLTSSAIGDYFNRDFNVDQLKYINLYEPVDSSALYKGMSNVKAAELKRKNDEAQAEYFKMEKEAYTELIKAEYPMLDEYKSWQINGYGLTPNSPEFSIEEKFTLDDLVKKAGNGYMVNIGALFGNYEKLQDDSRKRNYNGSLEVATVKTATITFEIPEGYKASLLESANKSFGDNFITFQSSLKVEGNTVVLTVTREIKKTDFTPEEYAAMINYYDVMYELTQVKVVLKKQ